VKSQFLNIGQAVHQGTTLLEQGGVFAPRLTAEVLLAHAIGCERSWLYAHSDEALRELWWIHYGRYLHQRLEGKPTQYITGKQEFYGREFSVSPAVLIPRPETEHVVESALRRLEVRPGPVVDVGTGSGAIAVTIALEAGILTYATDLSHEALGVAAKNARQLDAAVRFCCCDLISPVRDRSMQVVVSNPPYVPESDQSVLQREVVAYEPHLALFGGSDGMAIFRSLIGDAARVLMPGGWLIMEVAYNAGERVRALLEPQWAEIAIETDLAGLPRVVSAQWPG
jgi:release factor glutamine methyltransferase